jgi:signal transduction histidine kinase
MSELPGSADLQVATLQAEVARLRVENQQLKRQLDDAAQTSQKYLQNVAHQLTAPLNAIKWSIEALRKPEIPIARKSNLLSSIYSQGTILVHLIKNFALMSNLESDHELGQFRDKPESIDITSSAINLATDFQPQGREGGKEIIVDEGSFKDVLRGRALTAVKNLVEQALSNLLENAVKYSDLRTTIKVEAVAIPFKGKPRPGLGVAVKSTGIPLEESEISKLVERGYRGKQARQRVPPGTGIGLYLAKRIMELHQGTIGIKANGREAIFTMIFPPSRLV